MSAKLIVLEGLDGAGKSTQIEILKKYFEEKQLTYVYIHFPNYGHNEASEVIASYLKGDYGNINDVNPIFIANMYAMDRFLYLPELQKHLESVDIVLLDRYVFSNMAYQGGKYDTEAQTQIIQDWIEEFEFGFLELPYPDLNIFLDVPTSYIEKRLKEKRDGEDRRYLDGKSDIHEMDIKFQEKVRNSYFKLKNYDNFFIVNCIKSTNFFPDTMSTPEEIFNEYKKYIDNVLFNIPYDK